MEARLRDFVRDRGLTQANARNEHFVMLAWQFAQEVVRGVSKDFIRKTLKDITRETARSRADSGRRAWKGAHDATSR